MKFKTTMISHKFMDDPNLYIVKTKNNGFGSTTFKCRYSKNDEGLNEHARGEVILKVVDTGNDMLIERAKDKIRYKLDYVQWAALQAIMQVENTAHFENNEWKVEEK